MKHHYVGEILNRLIRGSLLARERVSCIEDLHVWELDAGTLLFTASLHVHCDDLAEMEALRGHLKGELRERWRIAHATLELVPENDHAELAECCVKLVRPTGTGP